LLSGTPGIRRVLVAHADHSLTRPIPHHFHQDPPLFPFTIVTASTSAREFRRGPTGVVHGPPPPPPTPLSTIGCPWRPPGISMVLGVYA
jgi:hypothetical protein